MGAAKGGRGRLPSTDGKGMWGGIKDWECWKGESLNSRLELVSGAVSTGCVDRGMAWADGALGCCGPRAVWL